MSKQYYVLKESEMVGEGLIVFVSFWFFVRNFHTNCDVDCIKNIKYDLSGLFFLKNAYLVPATESFGNISLDQLIQSRTAEELLMVNMSTKIHCLRSCDSVDSL